MRLASMARASCATISGLRDAAEVPAPASAASGAVGRRPRSAAAGSGARGRAAAARREARAAVRPAAGGPASRCGSRFPAFPRAPRPRRRGPSRARRARRSRSRAAGWRRSAWSSTAATFVLHRHDAPVEFGDLAADVGGAARQVGDLAPTSKRSRWRPVTELTITSAVSTAMVTTAASMPVKANDR